MIYGECKCGCHSGKHIKHIAPCCFVCDACSKKIKYSLMRIHHCRFMWNLDLLDKKIDKAAKEINTDSTPIKNLLLRLQLILQKYNTTLQSPLVYVEYDDEGDDINLSWFDKDNQRALSFWVEDGFTNALTFFNGVGHTYENPTDDLIIELLRNFKYKVK